MPTTVATPLDIPALIASLTEGMDFNIPQIDLNDPLFEIPGDITSDAYSQIERLTIDDITDGDTSGEGAFDRFLTGMKAHLRVEYDAGRITGGEYTKAYVAMVDTAMGNAVQFMLSRETSFWAAHQAQIAAITARAGLVEQKIRAAIANITAQTAEVSLALAALQSAKIAEEVVLVREQRAQTVAQTENIEAQTLNEPKKGELLDEQTEAARAQTLDTRTDGVTAVVGTIGKQKDLYTQQVVSYQRDSEIKAGKLFGDAWITQKTIDEGLTAPAGFTNASLDQVLTKIKTELGMVP